MTMQRWIQRSVPLAAVALVGAAPMLLAQGGQELFEWSGRVDREVQITMRGNSVRTNLIGQSEQRGARSRAFSTLPRQDGQVTVRVLNGRGNVYVVEQPSAQNGYTTTIQIEDPRSGADDYRLAAYWQSYSNGEYIGRNRGRDRDNDRDNDRDDVNRGRGNGRGRGRYGNRGQNGEYGQYGQNGQNGQYGRYGNQTALHWSGNVDDELEIRIRNGQVDYRTIRGAQPTSIRLDQGNMNMSGQNGTLGVVQNSGRGSVAVIQQPSSWNGYTTVIRVRDPQGGYGFYDFDLIWQ